MDQGLRACTPAIADIGMALAKIRASMCRAHFDLTTFPIRINRRNIMKSILVVADIPHDSLAQSDEATLTHAQMELIVGGRSVVGTVDGGPATTTIDDFGINNAIWEGRISGSMIN
jgi:hypothetical protein